MKSISNIAPTKTIGFIVNPVAGMGGAVGLKGTDGEAVLEKALALGAKPVAAARAATFLSELKSLNLQVALVVGAGTMGEDEAANCGFSYVVLGERKEVTTAEDTRRIAKEILDSNADILVFCGGDGTARDILKAINQGVPALGVPTGVKMHSAVFAVDPKSAAQIIFEFFNDGLPLHEAEVMDVDEEAFRAGRVSAELHGYLLTPAEPYLIQEAKMASPMTEDELRNQAAIALYVIENMKPDMFYILGPGTTTRTVADLLDEKKTLLGVDIIVNKKIVLHDVNEEQILEAIRGKKAEIIVTPIGGQGFLFGRGNQQISPKVIREVGLEKILVIATTGKLGRLRGLKVDTGDGQLDDDIRAHKLRLIADYKVEYVTRVQ